MPELTIPEGSGDVILSYVRRKSAEWTTDQLVRRVEEGVVRLEGAMRAVPDRDLTRNPPGEEWTPLQCIQHVVDINRSTAQRCAAVAATGVLPAGSPTPSPADRERAINEHAADLAAAGIGLRTLGGHDYVEVTWPHPFLGELNWREWFLTIRVHCLAHADQLEAMVAALAD